ncbi:MAG: type II toxin-antitoxin system RelE/ParE family toxin [Comamonadaceae bacterium]|nr:type II toxin-antitoxin system RelE/ParE family toxin [Comamonadaceae bacterium]
MKRSMHAGASQDVANAVDFYTQSAGVHIATRFLNEFERVARLIIDNPGFGTPTKLGKRAYPLHGFPYSVVYSAKGDTLRFLVVRHQRQTPGFGSGRH